MARPDGFAYEAHPDGPVRITHRGRRATVLRGDRTARFLTEVTTADPQLVRPRRTGDHRRGNERTGRAHPRNRG
ncbi:hypothetical protein [Streptomyces werraensis]|uniref:hypothetical protein n=1 Tax=Streptomyces werraensis TaxID=68284 RepID=UPI0034122A15